MPKPNEIYRIGGLTKEQQLASDVLVQLEELETAIRSLNYVRSKLPSVYSNQLAAGLFAIVSIHGRIDSLCNVVFRFYEDTQTIYRNRLKEKKANAVQPTQERSSDAIEESKEESAETVTTEEYEAQGPSAEEAQNGSGC